MKSVKSTFGLGLFLFLQVVHSSTAAVKNNSTGLTDAERAGVEKLRTLLARELYQEYMKEDVYLVRWLREYNSDLEEAKEKLRKALIWRKEKKVDSVLNEDFRYILQNCLFDITGRDKEGRLILASVLGQCHIRTLALRDPKKLHRSIIFLLEYVSEIGRKIETAGGPPQQGIIIADLSGLTLREHTCLACLPFFTSLIETYQYYPETVKEVIMINVSRIGVSLINLLKPLAPPNQREKAIAFGFDRKEWQSEILKKVDADQLSPQFGGTKSPKYVMQT